MHNTNSLLTLPVPLLASPSRSAPAAQLLAAALSQQLADISLARTTPAAPACGSEIHQLGYKQTHSYILFSRMCLVGVGFGRSHGENSKRAIHT